MPASSPTTYVTEIPGRFCPLYIVDKRSPSTRTTDNTTTISNTFIPRAESVDSTYNTPINQIDELGANFHVGEYDDLGESKLTISCYDGSYVPIALITGIKCNTASTTEIQVPGTTTGVFGALAVARVDTVRQFADPNGNVFASMYQGGMTVDEYGFSLKNKSVAMETYSMSGFNQMKFKGFIQTKCIVQTGAPVAFGSGADSGFFGIDVGASLGTDEAVVPIPAPTSLQPASYWIQNGCLNFLKVERWNSTIGWVRYPELAAKPANDGAFPQGYCYFTTSTKHLLFKSVTDIKNNDVFLVTYCTYKTDAVAFGSLPYSTIYATDPYTSEPTAIPTRLTPFTIGLSAVTGGTASTNNVIPRGQSVDVKMSLKRERAEGVGDVTGIFGPPAAPEVSISVEVKATDFGLNAILDTGSPLGTDNGGSVTGDFYDPNYATRYQLANPVLMDAELFDPRDVSQMVKQYVLPTIVLNSENFTTSNKNSTTIKYSGSDRTAFLHVYVVRP